MVPRRYVWYVVWMSWCYAHECSLNLMSAADAMRPCSCVLMVAYECRWMFISTHDCGTMAPIALKSTSRVHGHSWTLMKKQQRTLMIMAPWYKQPSWVLISIHEHGAIAQHTTHSTFAENENLQYSRFEILLKENWNLEYSRFCNFAGTNENLEYSRFQKWTLCVIVRGSPWQSQIVGDSRRKS